MNAVELNRMLQGSLRYEIDNGVLTLTGYYSGKEIKLDLTMLTDEMLEELVVEDEDEFEDEE